MATERDDEYIRAGDWRTFFFSAYEERPLALKDKLNY